MEDFVWGQSLDDQGGEVVMYVFVKRFVGEEGGRAACPACIGLGCVLAVVEWIYG